MNTTPLQFQSGAGNVLDTQAVFPSNSGMTKKEKDALKSKRWRERHPGRYREVVARSLAKNRDKRLARRRELYAQNPEKYLTQSKAWAKKNRSYFAGWHRECRKRDPERYKEYESRRVRPIGQRNASLRKWQAKKQATDLNWRILRNLRTRLYFALKGKNKTARTVELLGCSLDDFKIYIESLFEPDMSWKNYGNKQDQWSVDHIVPCNLFDMTNAEHQRRCFHFSNLRPFWHLDNLRKGAKHEVTTT